MENIKEKIEHRLKKIDYTLPECLVQHITSGKQLQVEIKKYRNRNIQNRFRNFLIVALALAVTALILGKESYYYIGAGAAFLAYLLLSPSAQYTRNITLARQKLFLLELLEELKVDYIAPQKSLDVHFDDEE